MREQNVDLVIKDLTFIQIPLVCVYRILFSTVLYSINSGYSIAV